MHKQSLFRGTHVSLTLSNNGVMLLRLTPSVHRLIGS